MTQERISLMVMREGGLSGQVRSYSLPGYAPRLAIIAGALVVMIIVAAIAFALFFWQQASSVSKIEEENAALRQSMVHIERLEAELAYHRKFTRQLAQLVGINMPQFSDSTANDSLPFADVFADDDTPYSTPDSPDLETPLTGVLVTDCDPDPNNRPRGLPLSGRASRDFHPAAANPSLRHNGIDIAAREGSPIHAPANGIVVYAGPDEVFGMLLIVDHGDGFKTVYGHNSRLHVRVGDDVLRGDIIGLSGNTGQSTAPHLHYEIRRDDQAVDPSGFLGQ